jgi:hypothetical protein
MFLRLLVSFCRETLFWRKNVTWQLRFQGFSAPGQTRAEHCGHRVRDGMEESGVRKIRRPYGGDNGKIGLRSSSSARWSFR